MSQSNRTNERATAQTEERLADEHRQEASGRGATGHQDSERALQTEPNAHHGNVEDSGSINAATTDSEPANMQSPLEFITAEAN